ncbi:hypothetical protein GEMRC1_012490 [Eukaryota sp. GEM-RC1]
MSSSLSNSAILEERIRFVAPRLQSLTPAHVIRFIQDVCHFSNANDESSISLPEDSSEFMSDSEQLDPSKTLAYAEKIIADALSKYKPEGFSNTAFTQLWTSAKESVARSSSTSAISGSSRPLANDSIPSFFEDPSPPPEFHKYILPKVLSLINMIDPSALSSQTSLWNFLLDSTRVQNASEARNAVTLRCRTFIPHSSPKALISAFIKGIKPSTLRNALFDEFNLNLLNSLEDLVSRTIILHKNLSSLTPSLKNTSFRSALPSSFLQESRRTSHHHTPHHSPSQAPSKHHSSQPLSRPFCNFCKRRVTRVKHVVILLAVPQK